MTFEEWWSEYEETDNYLNGATNESTAFEAWHARDEQLATLRAQVAALTRPPMVQELPKIKGWYWRINVETDEFEVVHIGQDRDGRILMESTDSDGTIVVDLIPRGKWWSATPITPDPMPKEEL